MKTIVFDFPDISKHNGVVNFVTLRKKYNACMIRAGYGKDNIDEQFFNNVTGCKNNGIAFGVYWFSYAYTVEMAEKEAEYTLAAVGKHIAKCPVCFDLEYDTVKYARQKGVAITKTLATNMAIAYLKKVAQAGYYPIIYTNRDYANNYFDIAKIKSEVPGTRVWYARYSSSLTSAELDLADVWQYTSKGSVSGISGNVDLNHAFYDWFENGMVNTASKKNINISDFQACANADGLRDQNGNKLDTDGVIGAKTKYVMNKVNLFAVKSGFKFKVGSSGNLVKYWQRRMNEIMGLSLTEDGLYGASTRTATLSFQKKYGLSQTGKVTSNDLYTSFTL